MSRTLRLFFTTSCLSAVNMVLHAEKQEGAFVDVLVVDGVPFRSTTLQKIKQLQRFHAFHAIWDFSEPAKNEHSERPSLRKRLTRFLKTKPGFKFIYNRSFERMRQKKQLSWSVDFQKRFTQLNENFSEVLLFSQPRMNLLQVGLSCFPDAKVLYFEHGLGDTLDIENEARANDVFISMFPHAESHSQLAVDLALHRERLNTTFPEGREALESLPAGKLVVLATQPLEAFGIGNHFWDKFIERMSTHLYKAHTVLIKAHPRQDMDVCAHILDVFRKRNINALIWEHPAAQSINLELLIAMDPERFSGLYSPFSSSVFYLGKLLPGAKIPCYYSIKDLLQSDSTAAPIHRKRWRELDEGINQVFAGSAKELSDS